LVILEDLSGPYPQMEPGLESAALDAAQLETEDPPTEASAQR
jgi:hypothetical protein